jgi:membrane-associated protease RseP (regulator of RpoE activity)
MDLSFRIAGIPVQVVPSFFVAAVFLGAAGDFDLRRAAAWVAIVFVSVLAHELGHATVGRLFGLEPAIQIHAMGGTTSWSVARPISVARRIAISLAGPAAGFGLAAIVVALARSAAGRVFDSELGLYAYASLIWVNVGWGVLNLLPILPLDGGNVLFQVLNAATHGHGERPTRIVSVLLAVLGAAAALATRQPFTALLALWFVSLNWQALRAAADVWQ